MAARLHSYIYVWVGIERQDVRTWCFQIFTERPGVSALVQLLPRYEMGIFSSTHPRNVSRCVLRGHRALCCAEKGGRGGGGGVPRSAAQLFSGGVFTRDDCIADPDWLSREDGREWDTRKPLMRAVGHRHPIRSVVLVDNDRYKACPGEERNMIHMPSWDGCAGRGTDDVFEKLISLLLEASDNYKNEGDLRRSTEDVSARTRVAHEWASVYDAAKGRYVF